MVWTAWLMDDVYKFILDGGVRILVVDDDPIQREFSQVYLSGPSSTVETACDGAEALKMLRAAAFDIIMLDIDMPVMNGFETLAEIRADPILSGLPVVMVTGNEDIVSIDRAFDIGATSFITKPVNWRLLSYQMRYILRAHAIGARAA